LLRADTPESAWKFCKFGSAAEMTFVRGFPITEFESGTIMNVDGAASTMILNSKHDDYVAVREILIERYGSPTKRTVAKVRTKAGVAYESESLLWAGRRVTLSLDEYSGDVNTSAATFRYLPLVARRLEKERADAKSKAPKM
jgi:hypothetical protein